MELDQAKWYETMEKLQTILRKAAQVLMVAKKIDREQMHNYFMSGGYRNNVYILITASRFGFCLALKTMYSSAQTVRSMT